MESTLDLIEELNRLTIRHQNLEAKLSQIECRYQNLSKNVDRLIGTLKDAGIIAVISVKTDKVDAQKLRKSFGDLALFVRDVERINIISGVL